MIPTVAIAALHVDTKAFDARSTSGYCVSTRFLQRLPLSPVSLERVPSKVTPDPDPVTLRFRLREMAKAKAKGRVANRPGPKETGGSGKHLLPFPRSISSHYHAISHIVATSRCLCITWSEPQEGSLSPEDVIFERQIAPSEFYGT